MEIVCVVGFMKYAFTSMLKALFSSFLMITRSIIAEIAVVPSFSPNSCLDV